MSSIEEESWKEKEKFDVIGLIETWLEKGKGKFVREKLKGYKCVFNEARRENKKGRAKGGLMIAIRKEGNLKCKKIEKINKECIKMEMEIEGTEWLWRLVYMRGDREHPWTKLKEEAEKKPGRKVFLVGDFNCRIGKYGERKTEEDEKAVRKSMDEVCNEDGKGMIRWMDETGMHVLNGNIKEDEEGRFTYVGPQGNTIIDYPFAARWDSPYPTFFKGLFFTAKGRIKVFLGLKIL